MKPFPNLALIPSLLLFLLPLGAEDLKVGTPFPQAAFPSVYDGAEDNLTQLLAGKKTVLHLFASW